MGNWNKKDRDLPILEKQIVSGLISSLNTYFNLKIINI